jgi:hypothetical protein
MEEMKMATLSIADMFEGRMNDLVNDVQDARVHRYEDSGGVHYIQFGDGSVLVEPDADLMAFDMNEWHDFMHAEVITKCGSATEDE